MSQPQPDPANLSAVLSSRRLSTSPEYSADERATLLQIAHAAILSASRSQRYTPQPRTGHLAELRGVFTTLYLDQRLRGCIGYIQPVMPLYLAIAETAQASATEDPRFIPVEPEEAQRVLVSLSVLSETSPISSEEVEIGRHGLVVSQHGHRGLLLPQVAEEHHWDVLTFLEQTCYKAGLPGDAWKQGAKLEGFTAEIFSDPGAPK
jgi:AmmeMemoRadiSam system protein A